MPTGELPTRDLLAHALRSGKSVYVPRCRQSTMDMVHIRSQAELDALEPNRWGIPEPSGEREPVDPALLDFVVVPGVAFDRVGGRCGHGRGYYDRFLEMAGGAVACAVCLGEQVVEHVPTDTFDSSVFYLLYDNKYWNPDYPSKATHTPIRIIADVGLAILIIDYLVNHSKAMKQNDPSKLDFYHSYLMFLLISMMGFYDPVSDDVFTAVFAGRHVGRVLRTRELAAGLYDTSAKDGKPCVVLTIAAAALGLAGALAGLAVLFFICDNQFGAKDSVAYQRHKVFYVLKIIACALNMVCFMKFYIKFYNGKTKFADRARHITSALVIGAITYLDPMTDIVIYTATRLNDENKSKATLAMGLCIAAAVIIVVYIAFGMPAPLPKKRDETPQPASAPQTSS
ncbi:hypothetical protein GGI15_002091 [Coemansia interrupta]|uniref:5-formyltetrahydrofolate cyclo-ligase n=1 Tax=Coemansia interrupta TaxID=1126814 RepID=A0A9W8HMG1_9FUNG|nr:hypothetical protein GGI15_002091 [Coemansia interrupta]